MTRETETRKDETMTTSYLAEYSTTRGEMWVNAGEYESEQKARHALRGHARAGNNARIVRIAADAPNLQTIERLIEDGFAELIG